MVYQQKRNIQYNKKTTLKLRRRKERNYGNA